MLLLIPLSQPIDFLPAESINRHTRMHLTNKCRLENLTNSTKGFNHEKIIYKGPPVFETNYFDWFYFTKFFSCGIIIIKVHSTYFTRNMYRFIIGSLIEILN